MERVLINDPAFEEKRSRERRLCPQCALVVQSPFIERCPRCFATLPHINVSCRGCLYELQCPVSQERRVES